MIDAGAQNMDTLNDLPEREKKQGSPTFFKELPLNNCKQYETRETNIEVKKPMRSSLDSRKSEGNDVEATLFTSRKTQDNDMETALLAAPQPLTSILLCCRQV